MWKNQWGGALLWEPGTGKTKAALDFAGALYLYKKVRRVLVICPIAAFNVWETQPYEHLPPEVPFAITLLNKSKSVEKLYLEKYHPQRLWIVIVNPETNWRISKQLLNWNPELVIIDESHKLKRSTTRKARGCHRFGKVPYRLILTGTAITNSPLDIFSQWKFLNSKRFGNSFIKFRDEYAVMSNRFGGNQIKRYRHLKQLAQIVAPDAIVVKKSECLDLPPKSFQTISVPLSSSTRKVYDQMEDQMVAELGEGDIVIAPIVLTRILRLAQISSGFITDGEERTYLSDEKLTILKELIENYCLEPQKKIVIFTRFIPTLERIQDIVKGMKIPLNIIRGGISSNRRAEATKSFWEAKGAAVFLGQIAAAGLSIDLSCASTAIFPELDYSLDHYIQAQDRLHRYGQRNPVLYLHLLGENTIDWDIYDGLLKNEATAEAIIERVRKRSLSRV